MCYFPHLFLSRPNEFLKYHAYCLYSVMDFHHDNKSIFLFHIKVSLNWFVFVSTRKNFTIKSPPHHTLVDYGGDNWTSDNYIYTGSLGKGPLILECDISGWQFQGKCLLISNNKGIPHIFLPSTFKCLLIYLIKREFPTFSYLIQISHDIYN